MKKHHLILALSILVVSLLNFSCSKEEEETHRQKVTFSFENKSLSKVSELTKVVSAEKTDARYVVITIENGKGERIYDTKKIELYQFNGSYISEPVSLDVSDKEYKLIQFLVLDVNNNVIYCTPTENSNVAYLVTNPLPISFPVNKNEITKITVEVIPSGSVYPSDYGYSTFDFNVTETITLKIGILITDTVTNSRKLTNSKIFVTCNDTAVQYIDSLKAAVSTLILKDGYPDYTITANKSGYETRQIKLTNAEIKVYTETPLTLYLPKRKSTYSDMVMVISRTGATLKYQFKLDTQYVTDLTINSAGIFDANGNFKMNVSAGINETFSISSLTSGIYILKVDVADSLLFSKLFYK
ncbi:MAG: hypothetical protein ACK5KP_07280 [Paludibacteraceae bacterium]